MKGSELGKLEEIVLKKGNSQKAHRITQNCAGKRT